MKDPSTRVTAFAKQRPRVLVVDDDAAMCRITTRVLASMGCQAVTANSGESAITAWAGQGPFTLAIVDLSLGDMDGLDLVRALRESSPDTDVPFIILSGRFAPDELPDGVVAALLKPTKIEELQEAAKNAILNARSGRSRGAEPTDDASRPDAETPAQVSATRTKPAIARVKKRGEIVEEPAQESPRDRRRERG